MSLHVTFAYEQSQLPAYRLFLFREFEIWDGLKDRGNFLIKNIQTESFMCALTFISLLHQNQFNRFQSMKVIDTLTNSGDVIQREKSFACKIIRCYNVMIHHSESNHCWFLRALFYCYCTEFKAFIKDWVKSSLQICGIMDSKFCFKMNIKISMNAHHKMFLKSSQTFLGKT